MAARSKKAILTARQNARLQERIRALTQRSQLSTRTLADKAGLGVSTVRSVGTTPGGPTLGTLMALARALDLTSIDELLGPSALGLMDAYDKFESDFSEEAGNAINRADIG